MSVNIFASFACPAADPEVVTNVNDVRNESNCGEDSEEPEPKRTKSNSPLVISDIARANKEMHDSFVKTNVLEYTPDNKDKRIFQNFKVACEHCKFPGSFQCGSVWNEHGIVRSYSNSTPGKDKVIKSGSEIWYRLKSLEMQAHFQRNVESGQKVRFFRRVPHSIGKVTQKPGCKDMGLFTVVGFVESDAFVRLVEFEENLEKPTH